MATVELTPIVIHYTVTPKEVQARVRTYAGDAAIKEETHFIPLDALLTEAAKSGKASFDHADVAKLVPLADTKWGGEQAATDILAADIAVADLVAVK